MLRQIEKLTATAKLFYVIKALYEFYETSRGSDIINLCDEIMQLVVSQTRVRG